MARSRTNIAMRLHSAAIYLLRTVRVEDRVTGLTPARLSVLSVLVFGGPRTLTQLTEAEQVAAPTMTKLVAGLERDGYVRRNPDPQDGRSWIIHATAKATRALEKARERRVEALLTLLGDASATDWAALERAATIIEDAAGTRALPA